MEALDRVKAFLAVADKRNAAAEPRIAIPDEFYALDGGSFCGKPGIRLSDLRAIVAALEAEQEKRCEMCGYVNGLLTAQPKEV